MATDQVKIDRSVGKNMIKVSVSRAFGQGEQLNAEMDVPVGEAKEAVDMMYDNVITPRAVSYIKETVTYQLEQDFMAYTAEERDILLQNKDTIDAKVQSRIKEKRNK